MPDSLLGCLIPLAGLVTLLVIVKGMLEAARHPNEEDSQ